MHFITQALQGPYSDWALALYAALKSFLPIPSVEVVQLPLTLATPSAWLWYAVVVSCATLIGSATGYFLGLKLGSPILLKFSDADSMAEGQKSLQKYGLWAVALGTFTPLPDFIVVWMAGIGRMKFWPFMAVNGAARLLRSLILGFLTMQAGFLINTEMLDWWVLLGAVSGFVFYGVKKYLSKRKQKKQSNILDFP